MIDKLLFKKLDSAIEDLKKVFLNDDLSEEYVHDFIAPQFEKTIDLFIKVLKNILESESIKAVGPRKVIEYAIQTKLIADEDIWSTMLDDRSILLGFDDPEQTEDFEEILDELVERIQEVYYKVMKKTYKNLEQALIKRA